MLYLEQEDAILTLLEPLKVEVGLRTLESYGGQFEPDSIGLAPVNFPAVYCHLASLESDGQPQMDKRSQTLIVHVGAKNLRGEDAARRGSAESIGVYGLFEAVRGKLNRQPFNETLLAMRQEVIVYYSAVDGICVGKARYQFDYKTRFKRPQR